MVISIKCLLRSFMMSQYTGHSLHPWCLLFSTVWFPYIQFFESWCAVSLHWELCWWQLSDSALTRHLSIFTAVGPLLPEPCQQGKRIQNTSRACQNLSRPAKFSGRNMSKYCKSWTWPFQTLPQCPFAAFCLASDDHLQSSFPDCLQSGFALAHPSQF